VMDTVAKRRRTFLWCDICHKFNHNTRDCYKNEDNWSIVEEITAPVIPMEDYDLMNNEGNSMDITIDSDKGVV
jgi:hypothetical protein